MISDKPKYGAFGEKVPQRGDSTEQAIAGFFIGSSVKSDTSNAITQEFDRLMSKGELPTVEDYKSKFADAAKKLVGEDAYEQKMNGFKRKYAEEVKKKIDSVDYKNKTDAEKKEELDQIRDDEIIKKVQQLLPPPERPKKGKAVGIIAPITRNGVNLQAQAEADAEMDAIQPVTDRFSEDRSKWKGQRKSAVIDVRLGTPAGKVYDAISYGSLPDLKNAVKMDVKGLNKDEREYLVTTAQNELREVLRSKEVGQDTSAAYRAYQALIKRLQSR